MSDGASWVLVVVALVGCQSAGPGAAPRAAAPPTALEPAPAAGSAPTATPQPATAEPATAAPAPSPAASPAPPAGPPYKNTVRWSTASELDNFGYDVYRGPTPEGPFERLTKDPIPGAGTIDVPQKYSFVDDTIDPHQTYYYYVESISLGGDRERFTPVIRAQPKLPPP